MCVLSEMSLETFPPIWSYVNENGKNGKNPRFEILQFFPKLVETLPISIHGFCEGICGVLSGVMSFEPYPPIWSHVTKKKQNKTKKDSKNKL